MDLFTQTQYPTRRPANMLRDLRGGGVVGAVFVGWFGSTKDRSLRYAAVRVLRVDERRVGNLVFTSAVVRLSDGTELETHRLEFATDAEVTAYENAEREYALADLRVGDRVTTPWGDGTVAEEATFAASGLSVLVFLDAADVTASGYVRVGSDGSVSSL